MMTEHDQLKQTLAIASDDLGKGSSIGFETVKDNEALVTRFANDLMYEYKAAKSAGRQKVVFIVPVGPVGQFELWADRCNAEGVSLKDLIVINMDEYLTADGSDYIPLSDPLSFRRHMQANFYTRLDPALAPPESAQIFPDPLAPEKTTQLIESLEGVDVCFGGVGITGHIAFNDPPEPGHAVEIAQCAAWRTRVVKLSRETRLINAVTAARGNMDRIPELAVTVGMHEILSSFKVRIYMNRPWQTAIVRKLLHGSVTADVPASLLQTHRDAHLVATRNVTVLPEPELR